MAGNKQKLDEILEKSREVATKPEPPKPVDNRTTAEKIEAVLKRIETGTSVSQACREENIPRATFRTNVMKYQSGAEYARALYGLAQDQVEKIEVTIDDMRSGRIDAHMARVEIDARKWFASKFLPRQYGDKVDITSNGKDLPNPILAIVGKNDDSNAKDEIIEGEIVDEVSQNAEPVQKPNILDDINAQK